MSAAGRLWRRAPAWRLTLAAAVALSGLTVMFPPALPRWLPWHPPGAAAPPAAVPAAAGVSGLATAHFVPLPAAPPQDYGVVAFAPPGPGATGIIPFAGRKLPLPAGEWQELVLAQSGGVAAEQATVRARIEDGHLAGLLLAAAPGPVGGDATPGAGQAACFVADVIARQVIPTSTAQDPLARECWTLTGFDPAGVAGGPQPDDVMRGALDRLARMAVPVPGHMLALRYVRTDATGWLTVLLLLPDRRAGQPETVARLDAWMRRYAVLLHKGYEGTITAAELTPAALRYPE